MGTMSIVPIAGTHRIEEFSAVGVPRLFQFHPMGPPGTVLELIRRAEGLGYTGFCVTLDCPVPGWRERQLRDAHRTPDLGHLATLFPADERHAPIVTVQDGASHGLAFLGSVYGAPVVPLGMDQWGQSGSRGALYDYAGIDVDEIVNAAMLALELNEG